ncbi:hypothetical protein JXB31_05545 [Candidatus Woesearchaeota archaeon]|nr:hypothetical protein [Candidatus Woesearchaeota archaeon]
MDTEKLHIAASGIFFLVAFFIMISVVNSSQAGSRLDAMAVSEQDQAGCDDGTLLYECSTKSPGNICELTKSGPELRFSDQCYD